MKRYIALVFLSACIIANVSSQDIVFKQQLSSDTVLLGNLIELKYTVENTQGDFQAPDLSAFMVVSGPNVASQFSMINGKVTQSASYSYFLKPASVGQFEINSARLENGENLWTTDPITINVLPNPDGIIVRPNGFGFSQKIIVQDSIMTKQDSIKAKLKKVKTYKI